MSTETVVKSANWRYVELGRVVLVNKGVYAGKLASIVEIVDHKRVLIDGSSTGVPRQSVALAHVVLTPLVVAGIARGAGSAAVAKKWESSNISSKWEASSWAKKIAQRERRSQLSDFERFQVIVLKKQRRYALKKAIAKN
ncbi:hypothetical protein NADFUDRAFT_26167 [Nadsonia fulvescens var. elongata DSM 6958]|uniref:Large ribosomal subunit protein eL14 domain-containing protein n=1 Tax=Nadsonia fulvescens var. elongata DSM 6958 TaxID=857566 RepID=A0A1E3PGC9_9ASCO|nr:hypothetical protein NADFUDRAFT_26167 [Nadsonia fulvescens var. elongata DSM 6958]